MTATSSRRRALAALRAVRRGELLDRALGPELAALSRQDRAWTQELVYGSIRLEGRLDFILDRHVRGGLGRLQLDVLDVLRLGAYQLLEMGGVPAYAAVSQSVELAAEAAGRGAAGLVNAVLKAVDRDRTQDAAAFPTLDSDPVGRLSTWGAHPRWLVERWIARLGVEEAAALVEANNRRPALCLRPVGVTPGAAAATLERAGVVVRPVDWAPDALCVASGEGAAGAMDVPGLLALVPAVVQDPAASLVPHYAALPQASVADLCAAPGGKTLGLRAGGRFVAALDVSEARLRLLRENVTRVSAMMERETAVSGGVAAVVADARRPPLRPLAGVLLDAPCTGTGTWRRHPDGRLRLQPRDLAALTALQRAILDSAAQVVAPGGVLVYATCSLEREENEGQVEAFLERHPEFEETPPPELPAGVADPRGRLAVWPQRHGFDGAFAARFTRRR